jgi:MFS family permease
MLDILKKHDRRLWTLALGGFISSVGFALSIPFISIYFHSELGLSLTEIGIFFGFAAIIRSATQAVGGELSDKLGRFRILVIAQLLRSGSFLALAYSIYAQWDFPAVGGLVIANFIFGSFFMPAMNASVADLVDSRERTEGYAIIRVADNLGWAAGPALGGYLAANSYSKMFFFSAVITAFSALVIGVFLKGLRMPTTTDRTFVWKDIFYYKENKIIYRYALTILLLYLAVAQMIAPFSLYSVDFKGLQKEQLGMLFTLNGLMVTFLQIPITRLLRRVKLTNQLTMGSITYAVGYLWIGLSGGFNSFIAAFMIITLGENIVSPPAMSIAANLAPEGKVGRYMGIYGFALTAGWSLGPLLGGILLDLAKPHFIYMWSAIAILAFCAAVGFKRMARLIPAELDIYRK